MARTLPCYWANMVVARVAALCLLVLLAACGRSGTNWHATDVTGAVPEPLR